MVPANRTPPSERPAPPGLPSPSPATFTLPQLPPRSAASEGAATRDPGPHAPPAGPSPSRNCLPPFRSQRRRGEPRTLDLTPHLLVPHLSTPPHTGPASEGAARWGAARRGGRRCVRVPIVRFGVHACPQRDGQAGRAGVRGLETQGSRAAPLDRLLLAAVPSGTSTLPLGPRHTSANSPTWPWTLPATSPDRTPPPTSPDLC